MDPVTVMLLVSGVSMLISAGTFAGGIAHAESLTARSQKYADEQAKAAEARSIAFAKEQEERSNAQLASAMRRTNPYGSNTADKLE